MASNCSVNDQTSAGRPRAIYSPWPVPQCAGNALKTFFSTYTMSSLIDLHDWLTRLLVQRRPSLHLSTSQFYKAAWLL